MAARIIADQDGAVLYCSTDMEAFGPVFDDLEAAEDFLEWLPADPRTLGPYELKASYHRWHDLAYDGAGNFAGRDREPTDNEIYNRVGVEGGIGYDTTADTPGSLGENDWRL